MNMPSLDLFDPIPSLNNCRGSRRSHRRDKTNDKARKQEWFLGVFHEATNKRTHKEANLNVDIDINESADEGDEPNEGEVHF